PTEYTPPLHDALPISHAAGACRWGCPGLIARVISSRAVESGYTPGTRALPLAAHSQRLQLPDTSGQTRLIHPSAVQTFRHLECSDRKSTRLNSSHGSI